MTRTRRHFPSPLGLRFEACVGDGLDDALALAHRYGAYAIREAPDPRASEYALVRIRHGRITAIWRTRGHVADIARDAEGRFIVAMCRSMSLALGLLDVLVQVEGDDTLTLRPLATLPSSPSGLAALTGGGGGVVSWPYTTYDDDFITVLDADGVHRIPTRTMGILEEVRGVSRTHLVAAYRDETSSRLAWWNGSAWSEPAESPGSHIFALHTVDAHTSWAASLMPNRLLRATDDVWHVCNNALSDVPMAIAHDARGVLFALWRGGVARASGPASFETLGVAARRLHVSRDGTLLATSYEAIVECVDDRARATLPITALEQVLDGIEPLYLTDRLDSDRRAWVTQPAVEDEYVPPRYRFSRIVGDSFDDAVFACSRYAVIDDDDEDDIDADAYESFVGHLEDGAIRIVRGLGGIVRDIARSPEGTLWAAVSHLQGLVRVDLRGEWTETRLPVSYPNGLCVVADDCVVAWSGSSPGATFWRWDGHEVHPMPAPDMGVYAMHGCSPTCIVAVGTAGHVARWDGEAWRMIAIPSRAMLARVLVHSPDEMYATGFHGDLLEGSEHGWSARTDVYARVVARHRGEWLVAGLDRGYAVLRDEGAVRVDAPVFPVMMHGGADALLVTERDGWVEVREGVPTRRIDVDDLREVLRDRPPTWPGDYLRLR